LGPWSSVREKSQKLGITTTFPSFLDWSLKKHSFLPAIPFLIFVL